MNVLSAMSGSMDKVPKAFPFSQSISKIQSPLSVTKKKLSEESKSSLTPLKSQKSSKENMIA